ncbi:MAG: hypothetical protein H8D47_02580 [Planctomycetes bacterium]|nr:hypothetical protein [Planctomycetota bacterium]MBL7106070.1 hypothetical protein [Phycisphaerae bacterium]
MLIDRWTKTNFASRNVILSGLVMIAAIALYNWLIQPHVGYLWATERYEQVSNKLINKNKGLTVDVAGKRKTLKDLEREFESVCGYLFELEEAKQFLSNIETMAEQTDCQLRSLDFSPLDPQKANGIEESDTSVISNTAVLSLTGGYSNIVALINKLQNQQGRVWINSINITLLPRVGLTCEITIKFYIISE